MMDVMVSRERTVAGKPTSLLDLGYSHVGLDGGWNYCFPENNTFHWASNGRPVWNADFPDPKAQGGENASGLYARSRRSQRPSRRWHEVQEVPVQVQR